MRLRVLLDEQLPRDFARELPGHDVRTVGQQGWSGFTNGELLSNAVSDAFQVLTTADQNLEFQQNLIGSPLGVVVLLPSSTALEDLRPLASATLDAIASIRPGEVIRVANPQEQ